MTCPTCKSSAYEKVLFTNFNGLNYGHMYCAKCGISYDSNINKVLDDYSDLDDNGIATLEEDEYKNLFIETSDITGGSDDVYTSFNWDDQKGLKAGIVHHLQVKIAERHSAKDEFSVLDIGCGDGFTTALLSKIYPNATFVAIDPSPQVKKLRGNKNIRTHQGILQTQSFKGESFDYVIIYGNLMLHADPFDTLAIAKDLLEDDGRLLFDFKNINSASRVLARILSYLKIKPLNHKIFIQRNFLNMRYGLSKSFMLDFCNSINLDVENSYSKPPRLLEFPNKSTYVQGLSGLVWRILNKIDKFRDEMAWVQFTCKKNNQS